mmetsp:Transcript_2548/g.8132  ORF Transcript_2548/g.8132 Transcript_2548/m.8132 type:complete len:225 (+) Transcript_2548:10-684(+)
MVGVLTLAFCRWHSKKKQRDRSVITTSRLETFLSFATNFHLTQLCTSSASAQSHVSLLSPTTASSRLKNKVFPSPVVVAPCCVNFHTQTTPTDHLISSTLHHHCFATDTHSLITHHTHTPNHHTTHSHSHHTTPTPHLTLPHFHKHTTTPHHTTPHHTTTTTPHSTPPPHTPPHSHTHFFTHFKGVPHVHTLTSTLSCFRPSVAASRSLILPHLTHHHSPLLPS